jgi:hypothetical protein
MKANTSEGQFEFTFTGYTGGGTANASCTITSYGSCPSYAYVGAVCVVGDNTDPWPNSEVILLNALATGTSAGGGGGGGGGGTAWAVVQSKSATTASLVPTISVTLNSAPTTGDVIIVCAAGGNTTPPAISGVKDSNGVALSEVGGIVTTYSVPTMFRYVVPATPSTTFTATLSEASSCSILAQEVSGITATSDGTASFAHGTTQTSLGTGYASTATGEYVISFVGDPGSHSTDTAPAGWTLDPSSVNDSGNANVVVAYKTSVGGSEGDTWSVVAPQDYGIITVAFTL